MVHPEGLLFAPPFLAYPPHHRRIGIDQRIDVTSAWSSHVRSEEMSAMFAGVAFTVVVSIPALVREIRLARRPNRQPTTLASRT
jgi:hypothetical protein